MNSLLFKLSARSLMR